MTEGVDAVQHGKTQSAAGRLVAVAPELNTDTRLEVVPDAVPTIFHLIVQEADGAKAPPVRPTVAAEVIGAPPQVFDTRLDA